MDIIQLIKIEDIASLKPISMNTDVTKKLNTFIQEAQEFDVMKFLGDEFYISLETDFAAQPSLAVYSDLFNGCSYTYQGVTYRHRGIKTMLVYYSYARFIANVQSNQTAFGNVMKVTPESQPVSDKTITRQVDQALSAASKYQADVYDYLCRLSSTYPLWKNRVADRQQKSSIRVSAVGGNRKLGSSYCCRTCGRYSNCNCNI
jgi:hypothetical protein